MNDAHILIENENLKRKVEELEKKIEQGSVYIAKLNEDVRWYREIIRNLSVRGKR